MSGRRECWRSGCARSIRRSPVFIPMYIYPSSVHQIGEETLVFSLKVVSRWIVESPSTLNSSLLRDVYKRQWLQGYLKARYGGELSPEVMEAWRALEHTVYNAPKNYQGEGTVESLLLSLIHI